MVDIRPFKSGLWPDDPCFLFYVLSLAGIIALWLVLCLIAFLLAFFFFKFCFFGFLLAIAGPGVATGFSWGWSWRATEGHCLRSGFWS